MSEQLEALKDEVIASLDKGYDLVYIDYRDGLRKDQIEMLVTGDWESLWESGEEWESDSRHAGAAYAAEEATKAVIRSWEARDERDYPDLWDEFHLTDQYDEVMEAIKDRDTSDPWRDLAHHSGIVLMRQVVADEDAALYGNHTPTAVYRWLKDGLEEGSVFKRTKHNLDIIRSVIAESMHSQGYSMGMLVYAVDVGDIWDLGWDEDTCVEVTNPYLYIGNYYQGDGFCSEEPLEATIRIKRSDLTTDKGAAGYGWDEVAGVYVPAYEAKIKLVESEQKEKSA